MTSPTQILTAKQKKLVQKTIPRSQVVGIHDGEDELKNIAGQDLTYNSKKFHWLNKQLDLERTMSELGKRFLKKNQMKKKTENQCQNAARENEKPLVRHVILILTKN